MAQYRSVRFTAPAVRSSEDLTKGGGKIYTYYYRVESVMPILKSGHGEELPIVFCHPEKESGVKMVDWDRTYFLTKYYML